MSIHPSFVDSARISPQGALPIPKGVRDALGVKVGDQVSFVVSEGDVRIVNSAVYAMTRFQNAMKGESERLGFATVEDAMAFAKEIRDENE